MLYVFNVDTGAMFTFDMSLAVESVNHLMLHIEKTCNIAVDKQVLLVSGGDYLDPTARVCSYSAGTDTNPIYLFNLALIESPVPPPPTIEHSFEIDFHEKVRESNDMPATYNTVCHRTLLAQQFYDSAKDVTRICENIVHEQHLQQQGWAAVIANFEDTVASFTKRAGTFQNNFKEFMNERELYLDFLQHFYEDLQTLSKIPILPALSQAEKRAEKEESSSDQAEPSGEQDDATPIGNSATLLEWITSTDNKTTIDQLFRHCSDGLQQFDTKIYNNLESVIQNILLEVKMEECIDIKGLGDRLFGLEKLMFDAKKHVQEQGDLAQSFSQNQSRANNIGDTSILPDLCASHRKQLKVMLENHNQLIDNRRRCVRAKGELGEALHRRLRWIVKMEDLMRDLSHKMLVYRGNLQRLRGYLQIVQQIHLAPATYLSAVAEVVRRRAFSQAFLSWASELACYLLTIHNDEITRRKDFQAQFDSHFLNSLFPGLEDMPPAYATEAPLIFDSSLPKLTVEHIEQLKRDLPELAENISAPDIAAINNLFMVKSFVKMDLGKLDYRGVEEKLVQVVNDVGLASNLDRNLLKPTESESYLLAHGIPHLKDLDKGCESETDTEEFEKVGQSPLELHFDKEASDRPRTQDVSTLTEVGDRTLLPPKKPPRAFQKPPLPSCPSAESSIQILSNCNTNVSPQTRAMSFSGSQSNTESFANVKNPSLESIDELYSIKNFNSNTESCFNSHHQHMQSFASAHFSRSKSLSPHTPQSPKELQGEQASPGSPVQGHQLNEFVSDEFFIDESLPSSLSIENGQSQGEFVRQLDTANNVVALLQDNLQISRSEHDRLKSLLLKMAVLSRHAIGQLRLELNELKTSVLAERNNMEAQYESLTSSWENLAVEMDNKEKEVVHRITVDHELEINDFKKLAENKQHEVRILQNDVIHLESSLRNSTEEIAILKKKMDELQEDHHREKQNFDVAVSELKSQREQATKDMAEKLNREHKAELENIRSRFRLMAVAKMERTPSDSNLEIERDNKELSNHEAIISQLKENYEIEKKKAVNTAVVQESRKWESILNEKLAEMKIKYELEKEIVLDEIAKKISDEKDKQIDLLREREANLSLECIKYRNTIQQLAEGETESQNVELIERVEILEKEKTTLEAQLILERTKKVEENVGDMEASVAICEGKVNIATSPIKQTEKLTKSQTALVKSGRLSIDSCQSGDAVLVLWDSTYNNYRIIQEGNHLYFLHSDCLETLGVNVKANEERKPYFTGEVVDKDYCHAKKVKPLSALKESKEKEKSYMSHSETASVAECSKMTETSASWSLPVTPLKQSPTEADAEPKKSELEIATEINR